MHHLAKYIGNFSTLKDNINLIIIQLILTPTSFLKENLYLPRRPDVYPLTCQYFWLVTHLTECSIGSRPNFHAGGLRVVH